MAVVFCILVRIELPYQLEHILCKNFRIVAKKEVNMSQFDFTRVESVGQAAISYLPGSVWGVGTTSTAWPVFSMLGGVVA